MESAEQIVEQVGASQLDAVGLGEDAPVQDACAQGAEVIGAELELHYQPSWLEGLDIRINTGFLKTEYTSFVNTLYRLPPRIPNQPPPDPAPIPINYTGNAMIGAPMWTANGSAQYTFPLLVGGADFGEFVFAHATVQTVPYQQSIIIIMLE